MMRCLLLTLSILVLPVMSQAKPEAQYVADTCLGDIEHRLLDRTRVDCLTDSHAIEYDFSHKWAEAIGQSLHYSLMTNRRAGIVLIGSQEDPGFKRAKRIIKEYQLPVTLNSLRRAD